MSASRKGESVGRGAGLAGGVTRKPKAAAMRATLALHAVALMAVMLAACAQPVFTDPSPPVVEAPALEPEATASAETRATPAVRDRSVPVRGKTAAAKRAPVYGLASYYSFRHAQTANGEQFDAHAMTAAHPKLPFGTRVRVTELSSGRSVMVRINDRGPFIPGRIIDLSKGAAEELGMVGRGIARVKLEVVDEIEVANAIH
jgi:rare lipoprotein A